MNTWTQLPVIALCLSGSKAAKSQIKPRLSLNIAILCFKKSMIAIELWNCLKSNTVKSNPIFQLNPIQFSYHFLSFVWSESSIVKSELSYSLGMQHCIILASFTLNSKNEWNLNSIHWACIAVLSPLEMYVLGAFSSSSSQNRC